MKSIFLFFLFTPSIIFAQYDGGLLDADFFSRQPNARTEAMGRAYTSIDGELATIFYNPSGIASMNKSEIYSNFSSPYYSMDKAKYIFSAVGYKFNRYLTVGLSWNFFTYGEKIYFTDFEGNILDENTPRNSQYTLTIASQPLKNFLVGCNTNYLALNYTGEKITTLYLDIGAIKKIDLVKNDNNSHTLNIGASVKNLNSSKIEFDFAGEKVKTELPIVAKSGLSFSAVFSKQFLVESLNTFAFLIQGDYQFLLNSKYRSGYQIGSEINFLEVLKIRLGYYKENVNDYSSAFTKNEINDFTFGMGIQLPFYKLTNVPLKINIDYTSLPQVSYLTSGQTWGNFNSLALSMSWMMNE